MCVRRSPIGTVTSSRHHPKDASEVVTGGTAPETVRLPPDPARRRDIALMTGEIPSGFNLPKGCAFAGRCPRVQDRCRAENPALVTGADGHAVACFNPM